MSYDIYLYDKKFLDRAIEEDMGDFSDADPIGEQVLSVIREQLVAKGYALEFDDGESQEYLHPNHEWGIQVQVFPTEISFSIPSWDNVEKAVTVAMTDAEEFANLTGLGVYDPQSI